MTKQKKNPTYSSLTFKSKESAQSLEEIQRIKSPSIFIITQISSEINQQRHPASNAVLEIIS